MKSARSYAEAVGKSPGKKSVGSLTQDPMERMAH